MNKCCNRVVLKGIISDPFLLSKNEFGWDTYAATLSVKRDSGIIDILPIRFSENLLIPFLKQGSFVEINGFLQSHTENSKLFVFVWAVDIAPLGREEYENQLNLAGYICKQKEMRLTPLSKQNITDFCLAINFNSQSFYIPIIAWNYRAKKISLLNKGSFISLTGRLQSRKYLKKYDDTEEMKTTYEVSLFEFYLN